MAVAQLVLTGVDAFVSEVIGSTTVRFSIGETDFDPARRIQVDLAKNPDTVQASAWAQAVDCDYQTVGGWTTIGPKFHPGQHVGGVYLSQRLVTQYAAVLAGWPGLGDDLYQFQAVLRSNNGNVTRYHGFKVRVLGASVGTLAHVAFIRPGAPGATGGRPSWIDLADAASCDPQANGFTTIGPTSGPGTIGAVFLTTAAMRDGGNDVPKYPRAFGW